MVDDDAANLMLNVRLLEAHGYANLRTTPEAEAAILICQEWNPDLVMLDLNMPGVSGYDLLAALQDLGEPDDYLPILVFTADDQPATRLKALQAGAADFLSKPGDITEIVLRVENFLRMRHLYRRLSEQKRDLEAQMRERTHELELAHREVVERLALAAEYRDDDTGEHARRVGEYSAMIAQNLGLSPQEVETIRLAAPLHDLGKIGISDLILLKPGKLTSNEFETMKEHALIGSKVLAGSRSPLLEAAETIARSHHEHWDGSGYPYGLAGDDIPLLGRIVAIADVYDALTSDRPYKRAMSHEQALVEIAAQSGSHFDPRVVEAFMEAAERIRPLASPLPSAA